MAPRYVPGMSGEWERSEDRTCTARSILLLLRRSSERPEQKQLLQENQELREKNARLRQKIELLRQKMDLFIRLSNWPLLGAYLEEGRIGVDNNLVENAIRPTAVERRIGCS